ncbi:MULTISPECIES: NAD(P)H-quinone oxidoreductase [unclassified Colwellia]|uniref:NAD(P)H-quinone oxidoreductase n=1 Tax=unclassified Colwellia TaxID=196834 RepID=UPI0015F58108|nr:MULTISPECIES: NAD(P)H-quinone oxidoreductase [unclassified Colwellia]MBA6233887.1 NAD(P)H-quinone oxidoreductase [Colwellia sp. MB02u-7]MBA6237639.1 NAD(P)H-quinone oxidoreductase [Colwellia sp. MB02u-11]MBA6256026.1 NAD(P)H-quinone oxidoreductase [Colwellia sp. MB3u-28]MBA6260001.1 NAD(P)H-quinone oxidoreductase [Colwellia sp. MB3u-41]MBA6300560.1 NAD(P)H-quinone oxidoreductase [Colwellia sp. MB3u-22]
MKYISVTHEQQLLFAETILPEVSADECLIKVKAIGVNRADILQRQGKYPAPQGESSILGLEVCGEIVVCGSGVHQWKVNDNVFGLVAGGGYAEYVVIKSSQLFYLPATFTFEQGAACAETFLTAYQSLFSIAQLQPKQSVLIHAGASGVGCAAIQLAKASDCFVVVTAGSEEKCQACLTLGADIAINYHQAAFEQWQKDYTHDGFNVIVDWVGGDYLQKNIQVAAIDGQIVLLSIIRGRYCEKVDMGMMLSKRIKLSASTLRNRDYDYKAELVVKFKEDFGELFSAGQLLPVIDTCYQWQNADKAHQQMLENSNVGKLVLMVS